MHPVDRRSFLRLSGSAAVGSTAVVAGLAGGSALRGAAAHADEPGRQDPAPPAREFRAMWLSSVVNIDWPSAPGLGAEEQQARD